MTNPGSEPPAMDATTAETPTLDELRDAIEAGRHKLEPFRELRSVQDNLRHLGWLASHLPALMADKTRMDFLERGGFTVFQSSERKAANAVDCRDGFPRGEGRFYADTIREAIDAAHAYDNALSAAHLAQGERNG